MGSPKTRGVALANPGIDLRIEDQADAAVAVLPEGYGSPA